MPSPAGRPGSSRRRASVGERWEGLVEDLDPWSDNLLLRDHRDDVPGEWRLVNLATEETRWIGAPDDNNSIGLFLVRDLLAR
jgi:hypothetical protein